MLEGCGSRGEGAQAPVPTLEQSVEPLSQELPGQEDKGDRLKRKLGAIFPNSSIKLCSVRID